MTTSKHNNDLTVNDVAVDDDVQDRVADHSQSILDLEGKSEAGVEFVTRRRRGVEKYKQSLKHLIPVRRSPSTQQKHDFPLGSAGCFSIIAYSWLTPLLWKIFRHGVDVINVLKVDYEDSAEFNARRLDRLWEEEVKRRGLKDASFGRVCLRSVRTRLCFGYLAMFVFVCAGLAIPIFFVRYFLLYLSSGNMRVDYGMAFVAGLVLCESCRSASHGTFWLIYHQMGIRLRSGSATFLFKKILLLKGLKDKTVGELVNLIANDSQRIFEAAAIGPLLIGAPVLMLGSIIYSVFLLGACGLIGCTMFLTFLPFSALISRLTSIFRAKAIKVTDKRVRMMLELLTCIKLIKMYAWEKPFAKTIAEMRAQERRMLERGAYVQGISLAMSIVVPVFASVFTFIVYVLRGNDLTATQAFTYIALLNSMRISLGVIPYSIKSLAEASVAIKRFERILVMDEILPPKGEITNEKYKICIKNASFAWEYKHDVETDVSKDQKTNRKVHKKKHKTHEDKKLLKSEPEHCLEPCLHSIDFILEKGQMVGICGSVGCGKSSLINAILGRMNLVSGSVGVAGSVAYVPQQAWIMNTTARNNILLGLPYEEERYKEVVEACALTEDFKLLVNGDETEIGERGINLSGGQKQRISLARAVYSNREIYLLDDPLSAVDVHLGFHIAKHCLLKLLRGRTVVFVTHQLQYLVHCDEVVFMKEGGIAERGSHGELMKQDGEYASLMKIYYTEHTQEVNNEDMEEQIEPIVSVSLIPLLKNTANGISNDNSTTNHLDIVLHRSSVGSHKEKTTQLNNSHAGETEVQRQFSSVSYARSVSSSEAPEEGKLVVMEERDVGNVKWEVYSGYMKAAGGYVVCLLVLLVFAITVTTQGGATWFLSYWLNQGSLNTTIIVDNKTVISDSIMDHPQKNLYILIYGLFTIALIIIIAIRSFVFMKVTLKASSGLHDTAFEKILHSPMTFFDTTPVGRIVNRFSADLDEIDVHLPANCQVFLHNILLVVFSLVMISYVSPWFLIALLPFAALFFFLFVMFLRCVRELKRQDSITKSPIISHVTASIQGIATIYSYGKVQDFIERFASLMDTNTIPFFIYNSSNRWLALRLDLICIMVTATTGTIIVLTYDHLTPALAGLALSYAIQMSGLFQFTVRLALETDTRFTCVQRIQQYTDNAAEGDNSIVVGVPDRWPSEGSIVFDKVKMRYRAGLPLALNGVTFQIKPCEKIGIVGRSGSGKSSLGVTLFRLVDTEAGSITIDGLNISQVSLSDVRSKVSIIPQDPVLFVGTVRYNLDPFGQHQDEELWAALEKCHVKDMISGLDEKLAAPVIENGENFSVGERQLLCLARALLRYSKILVLDEATAAIDTETDTLVQMTIKEAFSQCTMLIIAHRLNTVLTCDRILVMEGGKVVEYDKPSVLMSRADSKFKLMLEALDNQDMT